MMTQTRAQSSSFMRSMFPWLIVSCGMLFYCFNYFLRVSPGVLQDQLSSVFHINATAFGLLAGFYYWAYTPMQLPAGMIYDRFGVRFVLSAAILTAVAGLWVFINTDSFYTAACGRLMIGAGCAFAYIGTLKLAAIWLPANRFAFVAGLTTAVGMTSGTLAQRYLTSLSANISYHQSLSSAVMVGIVISVIVVLLVRNKPQEEPNAPQQMQNAMNARQLWNEIQQIFTNKQMWLIGLIGCLLYLPSSVFLDTWGVPYFKGVYGMEKAQAVNIMSYTFYGWIIAGPLVGAISDHFKLRKLPLTLTGLFAAVFLCVIFYGPQLNDFQLIVLFFLVGFCCGAHSICFALGKENNPIHISGTAVAVTNMMIMAGGMIGQFLAGWLVDLHASGTVGADGLRIYSAADFNFALSIIPIGVAVGIFLSVFLKETHGEYVPDTTAKKSDLTLSDEEPALEAAN